MTRKRFVKLIRAKMVGCKGIDWRKFENAERELVKEDKYWTYEKLFVLVFSALGTRKGAGANK